MIIVQILIAAALTALNGYYYFSDATAEQSAFLSASAGWFVVILSQLQLLYQR